MEHQRGERAENPYDPGPIDQLPRQDPARRKPYDFPRPPRTVTERGLAECRRILREHGAPEHGPLWRGRKD